MKRSDPVLVHDHSPMSNVDTAERGLYGAVFAHCGRTVEKVRFVAVSGLFGTKALYRSDGNLIALAIAFRENLRSSLAGADDLMRLAAIHKGGA